MLEIRNVTIRAGNFSLEDASLTIQDGGCHVIVGPTGSGKTLLLESVIGLRMPDDGKILLRGADLAALPMEKKGISYVPQDLALFPHLTVEENIRYSIRVKKIRDNGHNDLIIRLADIVGIKDLLKRSIRHLSGGEKQRVALVRAIAAGTTHLLLDEPFSALHQGLRRELWFVLKELQKQYNLTILMVTHDMEEAFFLGDTITVMINGKIQQTGPGRDIYARPETRDVVDFLGIRNLFPVRILTVTDRAVTAYCEEVRCEITLPAVAGPHTPVEPGYGCTVGIRPENVVISKPGASVEWGDTLLEGIVEGVFMKGASHTVLFRSNEAGKGIEIEVADCSFKRFNPVAGQRITILLRAENFFLLRN
jgi:ABC-type Fe3+/spermidine/putrescine transport system ATPase subunit